MGKGEIAHCEQCLHLPQCFQKTFKSKHIKRGASLGKGSEMICTVPIVNYIVMYSYCAAQSQVLRTLRKKANENNVEKEENAGKQHFLPFPQFFRLPPQYY